MSVACSCVDCVDITLQKEQRAVKTQGDRRASIEGDVTCSRITQQRHSKVNQTQMEKSLEENLHLTDRQQEV